MLSPLASPSAPSLASFPPELLDYLSGFISNPSDLLSLALTNSTFRDIVIPFHLHYRNARCFVSDSAMWSHLLENARRLQNVHSLELHSATLNRSNTLHSLPPIHRQAAIVSRPDRSLLLSAIKRMVHLKSVAWRIHKFHLTFPPPEFDSFLEEFWNTLSKHCQELKEVTTRSSYGCCDCALQKGGHRTPSMLFNLRRLTSLSYTFHCTQPGHSYNPEPLFDFLAANPELQALRLAAPFRRNQTQDVNLEQLFQLRLPELRTFSLVGRIATIPLCSVNDFFGAHPLLESICFGRTISIAMSSTSPRPNLLPKLKHVAIFSDTGSLVHWLFGELAQGAVRSLASVSVYLPEETNQESNHFLGGMSRAVGERLQALCMSFETPEQSIEGWTLVMTNICSTCPNLRRLDVKGTLGSIDVPLISGLNNAVGGNIGNWIAPLHAMRKLELFDPPKDFLGHLVGRTGDKNQEIKFNHDAMLQLTHTCPSLRLISGSLKQDPLALQNSSLVYIRSAGDPGKQVDLAESRHTEEDFAIKVELLDQGQSTDYVWELYSVSSVSPARDLWRIFLPHFDELRFASEM